MGRFIRFHGIVLAWAACLTGVGGSVAWAAPAASARVLVIVLDGLRPDYVTVERMPHLSLLAEKGVLCENHHAAFPTVTRVNSAAIATGAYPGTNGLLGNAVYFPEVSRAKGMSTADAAKLEQIDAETGGRLLTATTLAQTLKSAGIELFVASSGSTGSAFLLDPHVCGPVVNVERVWPDSFRERVDDGLGPVPPEAEPNGGQNRWAVDAYLRLGLPNPKSRAAILWLSDPDHTAHGEGVGAPKTIEALKALDGELGRILEAHAAMDKAVNVVVMSDHGFSTQGAGANDLVKILVEAGLKESLTSEDVVVVEGAIYIHQDKERLKAEIARLLQGQPWIGAVFSRPASQGSLLGEIPGTFSYEAIHWNHARSSDLLVDVSWTEAVNEFGFPGTTAYPGKAGHGTLCPWDVHNVLIAAGPSFKKGIRSPAPSGNVDIAPTVCRILGVVPAPSMTGRVLEEILADGPDPKDVPVDQETLMAVTPAGREFLLQMSSVGDNRYVDQSGPLLGSHAIMQAQ